MQLSHRTLPGSHWAGRHECLGVAGLWHLKVGYHKTPRHPWRTHASSSSSADSSGQVQQQQATGQWQQEAGAPATNGVYPTSQQPKPGILQRVKEYFVGSKEEKNKLAALGMGAFASYGVISNLTYCTCLTVAWLGFIKTTGQVPTDPGQWAPFLGFYAGLWTIQNFLRPMRFALAVALAPAFERLITGIGSRLGVPRPVAFGMVLACIAIVSMTGLFSALLLLGGFPNGVPFLTKAAA